MWQLNVSTTQQSRAFLQQSGLSIATVQPTLDAPSDLVFPVEHITPIDMVFEDTFSLSWTDRLSIFFSVRTYKDFETIEINLQSPAFDRETALSQGIFYRFDGNAVTVEGAATPGFIAVKYLPAHQRAKIITVGLTETIRDSATTKSATAIISSRNLNIHQTAIFKIPDPIIYIFTISNDMQPWTIIPVSWYRSFRVTAMPSIATIGRGLRVDISQNDVGVYFDMKKNIFSFT